MAPGSEPHLPFTFEPFKPLATHLDAVRKRREDLTRAIGPDEYVEVEVTRAARVQRAVPERNRSPDCVGDAGSLQRIVHGKQRAR